MDLKWSLDIWVALVLGMGAQWLIRGYFVVSEETARTAVGFVERHWKKQLARMVVSLVLVYYLIPAEWFTVAPPAFMFTLGSDKLLEDLYDGARRMAKKPTGDANAKP